MFIQAFSIDYNLTTPTTYVECVNFINECRRTHSLKSTSKDRFLRNFSRQFLCNTQSFCPNSKFLSETQSHNTYCSNGLIDSAIPKASSFFYGVATLTQSVHTFLRFLLDFYFPLWLTVQSNSEIFNLQMPISLRDVSPAWTEPCLEWISHRLPLRAIML